MNDPGPLEARDLVEQIAALLDRVELVPSRGRSRSDALTPADALERIAELLER